MIEMYLFVNPLAFEYWSIDPIIQKLQVEYGSLFKLTHILANGNIDALPYYPSTQIQPFSYVLEQMKEPHEERNWVKQSLFLPHPAFLGIKAAQCQGKQASSRFVHQLQIAYFCNNQDIEAMDVLEQCAINAELDLEEFQADLYSDTTKNALQADFQLANELQILNTPAIIFFSSNVEEDGLRVSSHYSYDIYANIVTNSSSEPAPPPQPPPAIEEFIQRKPLVSTETLMLIYNQSSSDMELQMKKLVLQRKVEQVTIQAMTFWKAL